MEFNWEKTRKEISTRGYKTKWIAEQVGIQPETLRRYLKGQGHPSAAVIKLLALTLGMKPEDIAS